MMLEFEWGKLPAYSDFVSGDIDTVAMQMKGRKFNEDLLLGVTSRCLQGKPRVILCKSLLNGIPFPTNFWLSCPALVKMAGQLESFGGVKKFESYLRVYSKTEWEAYSKLHAKIRICFAKNDELCNLRKNNFPLYKNFYSDNIGIGGIKINKGVQVKCLHLQIASFLSLGFHPGQEWLKERIPEFYLISNE